MKHCKLQEEKCEREENKFYFQIFSYSCPVSGSANSEPIWAKYWNGLGLTSKIKTRLYDLGGDTKPHVTPDRADKLKSYPLHGILYHLAYISVSFM